MNTYKPYGIYRRNLCTNMGYMLEKCFEIHMACIQIYKTILGLHILHQSWKYLNIAVIPILSMMRPYNCLKFKYSQVCKIINYQYSMVYTASARIMDYMEILSQKNKNKAKTKMGTDILIIKI